MGLFSSSKRKKELKEAKASLRSLEKRKSYKMATSTIDPTKALNEMQPWQVNQERTSNTLSSLAHKDVWGNEIREPDRSNPTRNRWERPLDTIRGFQESIDRGYRRSYYGGDVDGHGSATESTVGNNRYSNSHRYDGASDQQFYPHRMGASGTPLSNNSVEDHGFGLGAMNSRNVLNDSLVMNNRASNNHSNGQSNGYGGSYDQGGYDQGYGNGVPNYTTSQPVSSPLNQQMAMSDRPPLSPQNTSQSTPRTIQKLGGSSATSVPAPAPQAPEKKQRKSWLGKRLSKNK